MQSTITDEAAISELFGNIDIYLFDQLLRGRVRRGCRFSTQAADQGAT